MKPPFPAVEIVIPVHNEEAVLADSVVTLHSFLSQPGSPPYPWRIVIADNASTDRTLAIARQLGRAFPHIDTVHLSHKGRGRALREAWSRSRAEILAYMDVDLSTDLRALRPLIDAIANGHGELAIGTRLAPGSRVTRVAKRELISRSYNQLLKATLRARFSDAQCGFKAIRADVARDLLPYVADEAWFFDTELLVLAQRRGLRIAEIPVAWVDDRDSRVDIVRTAAADLRGVARLLRAQRTGSSPAGRPIPAVRPTPAAAPPPAAAPSNPVAPTAPAATTRSRPPAFASSNAMSARR